MEDESSQIISGTTCDSTPDNQVSMKRKPMLPRSLVWQHFEKFLIDGITKEKCKYCGKALISPSKNGTSGLNNHLKICPKNPNKVDTSDSTKKSLNFPVQGEKGDGTVWSFNQEVSRRSLVEMLILDELPFCFVEKDGFKKFMRKTQPLFRIPSRRTLTRDCYAIFDEERQKLIKYFKETSPRVCLTTDTWTSLQRINYMCLTVHFIDSDWMLHKRILNFQVVSSHKGDEMARVVGKCLLDWKLEKIFTITVDNASSNNVMVKELHKQFVNWGSNMKFGNHLHVRCMAHILNLIVQDGMKEIGASIKRGRQMVKYIRLSPARIRKFKECCELKNIECKKSLCLDVPTRWNSTYLMLDTAQHFETAFDRYDLDDSGLSTYLSTNVCEDGSVVGVLECDDWKNVRNVVIFLKRFYDLTVKVSGSLYVTSNVHFEDIVELHNHLKECMENEDLALSKMAEKMKEKFVKYWGAPEKMNKLFFIASILDLRNNLAYVGDALEDMYGEEKGSKLKDEVETYIKYLFAEYVTRFSNASQHATSLSSSSSEISTISSPNISTKSAKVRNRIEMKRRKQDFAGLGGKSELEKYFSEEQEPDDDHFDILLWWKVNAHRYKVLSEMARDVLAIPISSVASECAFSTGGRIIDSFRSSLTPKLVQALVCLQDWNRSESLPMNVEEDFDYLMQLELDVTDSS